MENRPRKLTLRKETLRTLGDAALQKAAGGTWYSDIFWGGCGDPGTWTGCQYGITSTDYTCRTDCTGQSAACNITSGCPTNGCSANCPTSYPTCSGPSFTCSTHC